MKIIPIPYGRARELCFPSPRSLRTLELELLLSPLSRSRSRCLFLTAKRHSTPFVLRKLTEASLNHEREVSNGPDRPLSLSVLSRFSPRPNRGGGGRNDLNRKTVESSSSSSQSLPLSSPSLPCEGLSLVSIISCFYCPAALSVCFEAVRLV